MPRLSPAPGRSCLLTPRRSPPGAGERGAAGGLRSRGALSAGKFGGGAGARRGPGTCREAAGRPSPARRRLPALQHAPLPLSQPAMGAWLPLCLLSAALAAAAASGESLPRAGPLPRPPPGSGRCPGEGWCSEEKPPGLPPGVSGRLPAGPARAGVRLPPPAILAASPRAVRPVPPPPPHGARGAERSRGGASAAAPRIGCPSACGAVRLRPRAAVPSARLGLRYSRQGGGHLRARRELLWIHRRTAGGFFQSGLRGVLAFLRTVGFERQSMEGERAPRAPCPVPIAGGGALPDLGLGDASCLFPK